jgi:hypothetical protein
MKEPKESKATEKREQDAKKSSLAMLLRHPPIKGVKRTLAKGTMGGDVE